MGKFAYGSNRFVLDTIKVRVRDREMLILAITSSTKRVGCAIGDSDGVRSVVQATRDRSHAELLAGQISTACDQAGVDLRDVGAVAVDVGPGLYTGLRVGVTTANALAYALRVPTITADSVEIVAFGVRHTRRLIATVIDAKRGEVFWAVHRWEMHDFQRLSELEVAKPDQVVSEIKRLLGSGGLPGESPESPAQSASKADNSLTTLNRGYFAGESPAQSASRAEVLLVGDGVIEYPVFTTAFASRRIARTTDNDRIVTTSRVEIADKGFSYPSAEALALYASDLAARQQFVDAKQQVRPLYLRTPDARRLEA